MTISETKCAEISAILTDIKTHTAELARHGVDARDPHDLLNAMEIIQRIEQRMLASMPQAAE